MFRRALHAKVNQHALVVFLDISHKVHHANNAIQIVKYVKITQKIIAHVAAMNFINSILIYFNHYHNYYN